MFWQKLQKPGWRALLSVTLVGMTAFWSVVKPAHAQTITPATAATSSESLVSRAEWEKRWVSPLNPNICTVNPAQSTRFMNVDAENAIGLAGGSLTLDVDIDTAQVRGHWVLREVVAPWGWLHMQAPPGFSVVSAHTGAVSLQTQTQGQHIAVALDACARKACDVSLEFHVEAAHVNRESVWLQADQVLPRLGLNGDVLLRNASDRSRFGLPDFLTLPDDLAALPLAGVAPAGDWQWQIRILNASSQTTGQLWQQIGGATRGVLDFAVAWSPDQTTEVVDGVSVQARGTAQPAALVAEVQTMQACVAARMGGAADVQAVTVMTEVAQHSAHSLAKTLLAGNTLWLPQSLLDDAAMRRADMARAIALRHVADLSQLRQARGAQWFAYGLPGAVGLLCAAEHSTPIEMQTLLQAASQRAQRALQASTNVGALGAVAYAAFDGWVRDYAPLASLDLVRRLSAQQIHTMLSDLGQGVRIQYALSAALGTHRTTLALSMPLMTDLRISPQNNLPEGDRWRWQAGTWMRLTGQDQSWQLPSAEKAPASALWLDAWPGMERDFSNNLTMVKPSIPNS